MMTLAGLGLFMGFLRAHAKAQSSTPTSPTSGPTYFILGF
jgi:hypothetical protein